MEKLKYFGREIFFEEGFWRIKNLKVVSDVKYNTIEEAKKHIDKKVESTKKAWETKRLNGTIVVWNKGLTKQDDERLRISGEKGGKTRKEDDSIVVWNKGLTKETSEGMKKVSDAKKGDKNPMCKTSDYWKDEERSKKYKDKLSKALIGKNVGTFEEKYEADRAKEIKDKMSKSASNRVVKGHTTKHSEESKELMRANTSKMHSEGKYLHTDTLPMRIFEQMLIDLNYKNFEKEYFYKFYSIDFADVENKIAFEVDGDFWHTNPKFFPDGCKFDAQKRNRINDKTKNSFLKNRGWTVLRFWEDDIKNNIEQIKQQIIKLMKGFE